MIPQLRKLVEEHAATPDKPLPTERELAGIMGVSRASLRRGLAQLESEGLLWRRQGKGTFVSPPGTAFAPNIERLSSRTNFFEVMEVRLHFEPILVQLAAVRASANQIAMIQRMAALTMSQNEETAAEALEKWDAAFHRSIAEAAGNRLFLDLAGVVETIRGDEIWGAYRAKARTGEQVAKSGQQHVQIAEAIANREPAKAAAIMREHLRGLQDSLMKAFEDDA
jgi:GntR family transcriptional regulator, transcriptional repressor for pyruvate dehydrogenase complex